jgi:tetratricopeptide (TPR) repeat protein
LPLRRYLAVLVCLLVLVLSGCGESEYERTYRMAKELSQKGPLTDTEYVRRLETADELLEQVTAVKIRASERHLYVLQRLLDHYENLEMWNKAVPVAERLTRLQPTNENWYRHLGRIHSTLSQVDKSHIEPAERAFRTALELNPNSVRASSGLGLLYAFHAEEIEKGRKFLRRAAYDQKITVRNRPHVQDARFALGKLEFQNGRLSEAQEAFESILDMESIPKEARFLALQNLGDVHRSRGATELAKQFYHRAYEIEPTDSQIRSRLRNLGVTVEDRFNRFE